MDGRVPAAGRVVMVLQVLDLRVEGATGMVMSESVEFVLGTIDPRLCVIPNARLGRLGELGMCVVEVNVDATG